MKNALKAAGLNDKEATVYLACLKLKSATAQKIAVESKLNRTTAYDIINRLIAQGFLTSVIIEGKTFFQPVSPHSLVARMQEAQILLKRALPKLSSLGSFEEKLVQVYTDKKGIKTIFEDILTEAKTFQAIASVETLAKLFKIYMPYFVARRKKKGIKVKLIVDNIPFDTSADFKILREKFNTCTYIYSDKVVLMSLDGKAIGIVITDKNFANTYRIMFDQIWTKLK